MMKSFMLPAYMDLNTSTKTMDEVKKHIKLLETQYLMALFLNVFNEVSEVTSFKFSIQMSYMSEVPELSMDLNDFEHSGQAEDKNRIFNNLHGHLIDFTWQVGLNYDNFSDLYHVSITRENIEKMIAKAMGQENYANWMELRHLAQEKEGLENLIQSDININNIKKI